MIRRDEWKLIYYHGYEPQLFNLNDDPDELDDRAGDPTCKDIQESLTQQLLADWDPATIQDTMAKKRADVDILQAWTEKTQPLESIRWDYRPEMNRLDDIVIDDTN